MGIYYLILPAEMILKDDSGRRIALHSSGTWHALRLVSPLKTAPKQEPQTGHKFTPLEDGMTQERFDGLYDIVHTYGIKHRAGKNISELKGEIEAAIDRLAGIIGKTDPTGLQEYMHPNEDYMHAAGF